MSEKEHLIDSQQLLDMELKARAAANNAHCPYSNFHVGSAVLADNGNIYAGCNVENAAYPSTFCAEANAVGNAVADGAKAIKAVLVFTPTELYTYPCGNCRQILNELSANIPVYLVCNAKETKQTTLGQLLPSVYGPDNLAETLPGSIA